MPAEKVDGGDGISRTHDVKKLLDEDQLPADGTRVVEAAPVVSAAMLAWRGRKAQAAVHSKRRASNLDVWELALEADRDPRKEVSKRIHPFLAAAPESWLVRLVLMRLCC